jgi:hypothetical protein
VKMILARFLQRSKNASCRFFMIYACAGSHC